MYQLLALELAAGVGRMFMGRNAYAVVVTNRAI